jgi:hypothetical protein
LKKLAYFSTSENGRQPTTIHHTSTTISPSKNHVQTPTFPKTPLKNASKAAQNDPSTSRQHFLQISAFSE